MGMASDVGIGMGMKKGMNVDTGTNSDLDSGIGWGSGLGLTPFQRSGNKVRAEGRIMTLFLKPGSTVMTSHSESPFF